MRIILTIAAALAACTASTTRHPAKSPTLAASDLAEPDIPDKLAPFGLGFPNAGDPCRMLRRSAITESWIGSDAVLIGCPSARAAERIDGRYLGKVYGITLVSIKVSDPSR